jgi:hypothetical protein
VPSAFLFFFCRVTISGCSRVTVQGQPSHGGPIRAWSGSERVTRLANLCAEGTHANRAQIQRASCPVASAVGALVLAGSHKINDLSVSTEKSPRASFVGAWSSTSARSWLYDSETLRRLAISMGDAVPRLVYDVFSWHDNDNTRRTTLAPLVTVVATIVTFPLSGPRPTSVIKSDDSHVNCLLATYMVYTGL